MLLGIKVFFPVTKILYLPIIKNILQAITFLSVIDNNELNLLITLKVVLTGFMQLEEIIYTNVEENNFLFKDLHFICFNITFFKNSYYITLNMKLSKIDTNYIEVFIILAATTLDFCLV